MIKISIVVCTYNRAELLRSLLVNLCNQSLDKSRYEIIVADNNSTDNTRSIVESFIDKGNVRYVFEKKPGPSHARNAGWRLARGEYVGFTDDDSRVPENWLEVAEKIIENESPDIFGGPYFPFYISPKPAWFKDEYRSLYLGPQPKILSDTEYLHGPNMFVRRSFIDEFGGFDATLGHHGDILGYGEEAALIRMIRSKKPDAITLYEPKLYVFHLVQSKKMKKSWNVYNTFILGRYSNYVFFDQDIRILHKLLYLIEIFGLVLLIFADCLYGLIFRNRRKFPFFFSYVSEHTLKYVYMLGVRYERIVQRIPKKGFAS
jgi:glycosyltransferase involved in cell wall biosynthesis